MSGFAPGSEASAGAQDVPAALFFLVLLLLYLCMKGKEEAFAVPRGQHTYTCKKSLCAIIPH